MPKVHHRILSRSKQHSYTSQSSNILVDQDSSNSVMSLPSPNEDQDEDDICPVCESECTCHKTTVTSSSTNGYPLPTQQQQQQQNANATRPSLKIKITVPPSFLQRNQNQSQNYLTANGNVKKVNGGEATTPRQKKSGYCAETMLGSENGVGTKKQQQQYSSPFSAPGQPLLTNHNSNNHSHQYPNSDGQVAKKRGRPTKAAIAARDAEKVTTSVTHTPIGATGGVEGYEGVLAATSTQQRTAASSNITQPKGGRRPSQRKGKPNNNKFNTAASVPTPATRNRKTKLVSPVTVPVDIYSSELSEEEEEEENDHETRSLEFPTFISAVSTSASSSSSPSSTDTDSDSVSDSSVDHPNFTLSNRKRRSQQSRNWEIRPRKKSVGAGEVTDPSDHDDSSQQSDEDESEDEENNNNINNINNGEEEDVDDDITDRMSYVGVATGWSDEDEESSFDADLFFANLSDSDGGSEFGNLNHDDANKRDDAGMNALALSESALAGLLAPFEELQRRGEENLPFDVMQEWDGQFTFASGLKDGSVLGVGLVDLDFEVSAAQLVIDTSSSSSSSHNHSHNHNRVNDDMDIVMATVSEEESNDLENEFGDDADIVYDDDSDGGDTTEDEFVDLDGVLTPRNKILLRFPASMGAIDPLSTISPAESPSPRVRARGRAGTGFGTRTGFGTPVRTNVNSEFGGGCSSPNPADILAGKVFFGGMGLGLEENISSPISMRGMGRQSIDERESVVVDCVGSESATAKSASTPTESTVTPSTPVKVPLMGSFENEGGDAGRKKVVVNEMSGEIPSPFPSIRRLRRGRRGGSPSGSWSGHSSKLSASGSEIMPLESSQTHTRPNSLLREAFSPYQSMIGDDFGIIGQQTAASADMGTTIETEVEAEAIELDDVLDASFLEMEFHEVEESANGNVNGENNNGDNGGGAGAGAGGEESFSHSISSLSDSSRWERVPMDCFRRSRVCGGQGNMGLGLTYDEKHAISWTNMNLNGVVPVRPLQPQPADGFSYGSSPGNLLKSSPFNAIWESSSSSAQNSSPSGGKKKGAVKGSNNGNNNNTMAVIISPVLIPLRDRDVDSASASASSSPIHLNNQRYHTHMSYNPYVLTSSSPHIKSRKELRNEKKKNNRKSSYGNFSGQQQMQYQKKKQQRHHYPNGKMRSTSAVQRMMMFSSFGQGSVPHLSI